MKVYRIEHKDHKLGPYTAAGGVSLDWSRYFGDKCPGPFEDGIPRHHLSYDHRFGFAYMRQMLHWFRVRDIFKMRKKGFRVYRYKVDAEHILLGNRQLAFIRARATVREEVKLAALVRHRFTPYLGS